MVAFLGIFTFTFTGLPFTRVVEQKALDRAFAGECMHDAYGDGARARNFRGQCGMPSSLCGVPFDIKLGAGPSETNLLHWSRGSVAVRLRVTTAPARPAAGRGEDRGWTDAKLASFHDATAH